VVNLTISNNIIANSNWRLFESQWAAGGIKMVPGASALIEQNTIYGSHGQGIWFDTCKNGHPIIIRNNEIYDGGSWGEGIMIEASENAFIYNNIIRNISKRGVYISASDNCMVMENTIVGTWGTRSPVELGGVPRVNNTLTNNRVYNNIFYNTVSLFDFIYGPDDTSTNNTFDYNIFNRQPGSGQMQIIGGNTIYYTFGDWQNSTQNDLHSLVVDPLFVSPDDLDFNLTRASPAIDSGTSGETEVYFDYYFTPRPQGKGFDIGAVEYKSPEDKTSGTSRAILKLSFVPISFVAGLAVLLMQ